MFVLICLISDYQHFITETKTHKKAAPKSGLKKLFIQGLIPEPRLNCGIP
jgi:hypothetical protein